MLFGFLAAVTQDVELVTGILCLPQRQTALVAKQAAEIDLLSGGRFRLGVGVGWNDVEFEGMGADFATRGRRIEEQIAALRALWTAADGGDRGRLPLAARRRHQPAADPAADSHLVRLGRREDPRPRRPARRRLDPRVARAGDDGAAAREAAREARRGGPRPGDVRPAGTAQPAAGRSRPVARVLRLVPRQRLHALLRLDDLVGRDHARRALRSAAPVLLRGRVSCSERPAAHAAPSSPPREGAAAGGGLRLLRHRRVRRDHARGQRRGLAQHRAAPARARRRLGAGHLGDDPRQAAPAPLHLGADGLAGARPPRRRGRSRARHGRGGRHLHPLVLVVAADGGRRRRGARRVALVPPPPLHRPRPHARPRRPRRRARVRGARAHRRPARGRVPLPHDARAVRAAGLGDRQGPPPRARRHDHLGRRRGARRLDEPAAAGQGRDGRRRREAAPSTRALAGRRRLEPRRAAARHGLADRGRPARRSPRRSTGGSTCSSTAASSAAPTR